MDANTTGLTIQIAEIRASLEQLLSAAEKQFGAVIDLGADYYWDVPTDTSFDLSREPALHARQLTDDVTSIRSQLGPDDDPLIWHDLDHLIGVLRRIAAMDRPK